MEKTSLKSMGAIQENSYKSPKQNATYSVILFWISILAHYLWSINPVNQNILVEYLLRIHFHLGNQSYISGFGGLSLQGNASVGLF